jgi:tetratricopeptide (TPR) repeat protein
VALPEHLRDAAEEIARRLALFKRKRHRAEAPVARLLLEQALLWDSVGDSSRALALYEEAFAKSPDLLPAAQGARRIHSTRFFPRMPGADPARLLAVLDREARLVAGEGPRADLLAERARVLAAHATPSFPEIVRTYRAALTLRPTHASSLAGLEGILWRACLEAPGAAAERSAGELAAHYAELASACAETPALAASCFASRAVLLERLGSTAAALDAYGAAVAAYGEPGPVLESYKRLLEKTGAFGRLREVLTEEAHRERDPARSARLFGRAASISYERLGDAAGATTLWEKAARRAPAQMGADLYDALAQALEACGESERAVAAWEERVAREQSPQVRAWQCRRLALTYESLGNVAKAAEALERARAGDPLHYPVRLALDRLYEGLERHEERLALWLEEAAKAPQTARRAAAYLRAARIAEHPLGRIDEAKQHLRAALACAPQNAEAFDALVRLSAPGPVSAEEEARASALIELYLEACQATPEAARRIAYLEKVAALWEDALGDPAHAALVYGKVLALEPTRRFALLAWQRALERSGNHRGLAEALELEADQATDSGHAASLRLRAAEIACERLQDFDRAFALLRRVLEDNPDHPAALRALLKAQEAAGRWQGMAETLERLVVLARAEGGAPATVPLWLERAEVERRLGRTNEAIAAWRAVLSAEPGHPVASLELAYVLRARKEWQALAELEETVAEATADPRAFVRAAERWEAQLRDDGRAQRAYERALSAASDAGTPPDRSAWEGLVRIAERRGSTGDLEVAYAERLEREPAPGRPALQLALGELLLRHGGDTGSAARALEAAVAGGAGGIHGLRLLSEAYRRQGGAGLERVLGRLADLLDGGGARRGVLWELGRIQEAEGRDASTRAATYLRLLELDDADDAALRALVRCAMQGLAAEPARAIGEDGQRARLADLLAFALGKLREREGDPATQTALELQLALLLEGAGKERLGEALALYRAALARDPESPTALCGVRRLAAALGDRGAELEGELRAAEVEAEPGARAEHLLRAAAVAGEIGPGSGGGADERLSLALRALAADPDSLEAAAAVSYLYGARGEWRKLLESLSEASASAKNAERCVALAMQAAEIAHTRLGDGQLAISLLMQAKRLDWRNPRLLRALGDRHAEQGAWAEAVNAYRAALGHSAPGDPPEPRAELHRALARLFAGPLGDPSAATLELRAARKLLPEDLGIVRQLAAVLAEMRARAQAEQVLAEVLGTSQPPAERGEILAQLAEVRLGRGDGAGAELALREAVALDPDPEHIAFRRWEALPREGGDADFATALGALVAAPGSDPRLLLRLGEVEVHRLGDVRNGLDHLRQAIQAFGRFPSSHPLAAKRIAAELAYAQALLVVGAGEEAVRAVREPLALRPMDGSVLEAAERIYLAAGRREEALVVGELRAYRTRSNGNEGTPPSWPELTLRGEPLGIALLHAHVLPPAAKVPALELLMSLAGELSKVFPPSLEPFGVRARDHLGPRSGHPWRLFADRAARALGVEGVDVYVHHLPEPRASIENFETPAIIVPASLEELPELEVAFAIGRLVAKVALRAHLLDKLGAAGVALLVEAVAGPARPETEELGRRIVKAISRKARRQVEAIAPRIGAFDAPAFARAIDRGALRTGYLLTGDLASALDHLRREGEPRWTEMQDPESPIGDLLRFALSSEAIALRRRLGTAGER